MIGAKQKGTAWRELRERSRGKRGRGIRELEWFQKWIGDGRSSSVSRAETEVFRYGYTKAPAVETVDSAFYLLQRLWFVHSFCSNPVFSTITFTSFFQIFFLLGLLFFLFGGGGNPSPYWVRIQHPINFHGLHSGGVSFIYLSTVPFHVLLSTTVFVILISVFFETLLLQSIPLNVIYVEAFRWQSQ